MLKQTPLDKIVNLTPGQFDKNILIFADFGCTTGFGNLTKELIDRLMKVYKKSRFLIYAINCPEQQDYKYSENVQVLPNHLHGYDRTDSYFRDGLLKILYEQPINMFFMINDIELAFSLHTDLVKIKGLRKKENKPLTKNVFYFPVDSIPDSKYVHCLNFFDDLITYTEYGKAVISGMVSPATGKRIRVINHGVDTKNFFPLPAEEKQQLRTEMFPGKKFIVGSVNRNSPRKDPATLIIGYAKFRSSVAKKADCALYLHMNPKDPAGINLIGLCNTLGLKPGRDVFFPDNFSENTGYDVESLNKLYNVMDVFLTTTTAEGWGLTITEAMAAGILVACPVHTSLTEITQSGNNVVSTGPTDEVVFNSDGNKVRYKSDTNNVCQVLNDLYYKKTDAAEEYELYAGEKIAASTKFISTIPWEKIIIQFKLVFNKYL